MGMPNLDYSNPLHVSGSTSTTYTATKVCYAMGSGDNKNDSGQQITINGTVIAGSYSSAGNNNVITLPLVKLNIGDTIVFPALNANRGGFAVFDTL